MLTIGTVAKRAGVRPSAIRYYEAHGLLRPAGRMPNGYRYYDSAAVEVLSFLLRAQNFGFTLREVKELLEVARRGQRPCGRVRELARRHAESVEAKIKDLQSLRKQLRALLDSSEEKSVRAGQICPLIDSTVN